MPICVIIQNLSTFNNLQRWPVHEIFYCPVFSSMRQRLEWADYTWKNQVIVYGNMNKSTSSCKSQPKKKKRKEISENKENSRKCCPACLLQFWSTATPNRTVTDGLAPWPPPWWGIAPRPAKFLSPREWQLVPPPPGMFVQLEAPEGGVSPFSRNCIFSRSILVTGSPSWRRSLAAVLGSTEERIKSKMRRENVTKGRSKFLMVHWWIDLWGKNLCQGMIFIVTYIFFFR